MRKRDRIGWWAEEEIANFSTWNRTVGINLKNHKLYEHTELTIFYNMQSERYPMKLSCIGPK